MRVALGEEPVNVRVDATDAGAVAGGCAICSEITGDPKGDLFHHLLAEHQYRRRVIIESDHLALIPSLGPLAPGHVLLVPRDHAPSSAVCIRSGRWGALSADVTERLRHQYKSSLVSFEHGGAADGSATPCSVAHAHVHYVPVPDDVEVTLPGNAWIEIADTAEALADFVADAEYLTVGLPNHRRFVRLATAHPLQSQLLRQTLATALGRAAIWNWRSHPNPHEAHRTYLDLA